MKKRRKYKKRKRIKKEIVSWFWSVVIAICLLWGVKLLVIDFYTVQTSSMLNTLFPGDIVVILKTDYGPKIDFFSFFDRDQQKLIHQYVRLPGSKKPKINDLIVFYFPADSVMPVFHRKKMIKRLAGLPGDSVFIQKGKIYVNGKLCQDPPEVAYTYFVLLKHPVDTFDALYGKYFWEAGKVNHITWWVRTDSARAEKLKKLPFVKSVNKKIQNPGIFKSYLYPSHPLFPWNEDHYGPLYIPKKTTPLIFISNT
jgi:signal peptidase I